MSRLSRRVLPETPNQKFAALAAAGGGNAATVTPANNGVFNGGVAAAVPGGAVVNNKGMPCRGQSNNFQVSLAVN